MSYPRPGGEGRDYITAAGQRAGTRSQHETLVVVVQHQLTARTDLNGGDVFVIGTGPCKADFVPADQRVGSAPPLWPALERYAGAEPKPEVVPTKRAGLQRLHP